MLSFQGDYAFWGLRIWGRLKAWGLVRLAAEEAPSGWMEMSLTCHQPLDAACVDRGFSGFRAYLEVHGTYNPIIYIYIYTYTYVTVLLTPL